MNKTTILMIMMVLVAVSVTAENKKIENILTELKPSESLTTTGIDGKPIEITTYGSDDKSFAVQYGTDKEKKIIGFNELQNLINTQTRDGQEWTISRQTGLGTEDESYVFSEGEAIPAEIHQQQKEKLEEYERKAEKEEEEEEAEREARQEHEEVTGERARVDTEAQRIGAHAIAAKHGFKQEDAAQFNARDSSVVYSQGNDQIIVSQDGTSLLGRKSDTGILYTIEFDKQGTPIRTNFYQTIGQLEGDYSDERNKQIVDELHRYGYITNDQLDEINGNWLGIGEEGMQFVYDTVRQNQEAEQKTLEESRIEHERAPEDLAALERAKEEHALEAARKAHESLLARETETSINKLTSWSDLSEYEQELYSAGIPLGKTPVYYRAIKTGDKVAYAVFDRDGEIIAVKPATDKPEDRDYATGLERQLSDGGILDEKQLYSLLNQGRAMPKEIVTETEWTAIKDSSVMVRPIALTDEITDADIAFLPPHLLERARNNNELFRKFNAGGGRDINQYFIDEQGNVYDNAGKPTNRVLDAEGKNLILAPNKEEKSKTAATETVTTESLRTDEEPPTSNVEKGKTTPSTPTPAAKKPLTLEQQKEELAKDITTLRNEIRKNQEEIDKADKTINEIKGLPEADKKKRETELNSAKNTKTKAEAKLKKNKEKSREASSKKAKLEAEIAYKKFTEEQHFVQQTITVMRSLLRSYEKFSGLAKFGSLFLTGDNWMEWRNTVSQTLCDSILFGGKQCWVSKVCDEYIDAMPEGNSLIARTPAGEPRGVVNLQAEKSLPVDVVDDAGKTQTGFLYKITYTITNPHNKKMRYNLKFNTKTTTRIAFAPEKELVEGGTDGKTGSAAKFHQSFNDYTNVCLTFTPSIETWDGRTVAEFCTPISQYQGAATNPYTNLPSAPGTCDDRIQNQREEGVDCGGPCSACGSPNTPKWVLP